MFQLTAEKRIFIVKKYLDPKIFITVQSQFESTFNFKSLRKKSIQNNVAKHRNLGASLSKDKGNCGRSRSAVAVKNVEGVQKLLENSAKVSA